MLSGYAGAPVQAFVRTDMDSGSARQRQRFATVPQDLTVFWRFTAAQMSTFRTFFDTTIHGGADWFTITLDLGNGLASCDARFTKPYEFQALPGGNWQIQGKIEVRNA